MAILRDLLNGMLLISISVFSYISPAAAAEDFRFFYSLEGKFHDRAPDRINRINAPVQLGADEPNKFPISETLIRTLNDRKDSILRQAFDSLGMSATSDPQVLSQWKKEAQPILQGTADTHFKIDILIDGTDPVGGSYGGLTVRVRLTSLHRSDDIIYGETQETVASATTEAQILKNLEGAYSRSIQKAFQDLKGRFDEEKKRPRARLRMVLNTKGLNAAQTAYATGSLFSCLYDLGNSLSHHRHIMSEPQLSHLNPFEIEYRLKKFDPAETEEKYIENYASQIRFETGSHGKHRCSSWKTPLEGFETVVETDTKEKRISLRWEKPGSSAP